MTGLPVKPTGKLADTLEALAEVKVPGLVNAVEEHLKGGTSAEWLAECLTDCGYPIGATTIKSYRRRLRATQTEGSVKL